MLQVIITQDTNAESKSEIDTNKNSRLIFLHGGLTVTVSDADNILPGQGAMDCISALAQLAIDHYGLPKCVDIKMSFTRIADVVLLTRSVDGSFGVSGIASMINGGDTIVTDVTFNPTAPSEYIEYVSRGTMHAKPCTNVEFADHPGGTKSRDGYATITNKGRNDESKQWFSKADFLNSYVEPGDLIKYSNKLKTVTFESPVINLTVPKKVSLEARLAEYHRLEKELAGDPIDELLALFHKGEDDHVGSLEKSIVTLTEVIIKMGVQLTTNNNQNNSNMSPNQSMFGGPTSTLFNTNPNNLWEHPKQPNMYAATQHYPFRQNDDVMYEDLINSISGLPNRLTVKPIIGTFGVVDLLITNNPTGPEFNAAQTSLGHPGWNVNLASQHLTSNKIANTGCTLFTTICTSSPNRELALKHLDEKFFSQFKL